MQEWFGLQGDSFVTGVCVSFFPKRREGGRAEREGGCQQLHFYRTKKEAEGSSSLGLARGIIKKNKIK